MIASCATGTVRFTALCLGATALLASAGSISCKKQEPVTTNNLDRPADIAFICLAGSARGPAIALDTPIPPADCDPPSLGTDGELPSDVGERDQLLVIVTNTEHGELAVVRDRVATPGSGAGALDTLRSSLVDSDVSVPEYTFIATGDFPIALATRADGAFVYSADSGSCTLSALDATTALGNDHVAPLPQIPLPGRPADLVALPAAAGETGLLVVSFPDQGLIAVIDPAAWDGTTGDCATPPAAGAPHIVATLPLDAGAPEPSRPARLALDAAGAVLYVSDEGAPAWHAVSLTDPTSPAPATGSPFVAPGRTGAIAVSPDGAFIYVADADHATVLLYQSDGTLLPENTTDPYGRFIGLDLPGVARDIIVFEGPPPPDGTPDAEATGPSNLYGIFAAVASSNGNVYFLNVDPLFPERVLCEASADTICDEPILRVFQPPHTVRNALTNDESAVTTSPRPFTDGAELPFDPKAPDATLPLLSTDAEACLGAAALDACFDAAEFLPERDYGVLLRAGVLSETGGTGFTLTIDENPGAERWTRSETWTITWEGVLPDTERFAGALSAGMVTDTAIIQDTIAGFCAHGILGALDATDASTARAQVEILDPPRAGGGCTEEEIEVFSDPNRRLFPVLAATEGELTVGPYRDTRVEPRDFPLRAECFGDRVAYRVRLVDAYALVGSVSAYIHTVLADAASADECIEDPLLPPEDQSPGRIVPLTEPDPVGCPDCCAHRAPIDNAIFAAALVYDTCEGDEPGPPARGTGWTFGVSAGFSRVRINPVVDATGGVNGLSNLSGVRVAPWADADELYIIDEGAERITVWALTEGFAFDINRTIQ